LTDLSGADLSEADLYLANLINSSFSGANLWKANLRRATLWSGILRNANLGEATLQWADLTQADLSQVNLSRADLREANLRKAELSGSDELTTLRLLAGWLRQVQIAFHLKTGSPGGLWAAILSGQRGGGRGWAMPISVRDRASGGDRALFRLGELHTHPKSPGRSGCGHRPSRE
jgi:uncharacterized protein YjbI with pentapeptide repeats